MLNTGYYRYLAGKPEQWDTEIQKECPCYNGLYDSDSLSRIQVRQHAAGRREATIWENIYGWCMGARSNLDGRTIYAGGRMAPNMTKMEVIEAGIAWANADPVRRAFFVSHKDLEDTIYSAKEGN